MYERTERRLAAGTSPEIEGVSAQLSPIGSAIQQLREQQSSTMELVAVLEKRLAIILAPEPPRAESLQKEVIHEPYQLAEIISDRAAFQGQLNRRLEGILDRLQL